MSFIPSCWSMYLNESVSERPNFFANSFTKAIVYSMIFNVRFDMSFMIGFKLQKY